VPEWLPFVKVLIAANTVLWIGYGIFVVRRLVTLFTLPAGRNVHGVLFLSTVSTQSLVIAARIAFRRPSWYVAIAPILIGLGVLFYLISFVLVARRYALYGRRIDLDSGWHNTNCIIHGAMSITGLASAVSGIAEPKVILAMWLWAIVWFVIVEGIETTRAVERVRRHGLFGGLFVYNPTQWSWIFTYRFEHTHLDER
jgi:hypothetical protein